MLSRFYIVLILQYSDARGPSPKKNHKFSDPKLNGHYSGILMKKSARIQLNFATLKQWFREKWF